MKQTLNGIVTGLDNDSYHSTSALSSTGLREFAKSPAHYQAYLKRSKAPSKAMAFGSGFHVLIGEPELFSKRYVKAPAGIDRRTKQGKDDWSKFVADNAGKITLTDDEWETMNGMLNSILANKTALSLLANGKAEQSIFWKDVATGVLCKCRPDYLRDDGIVVDLKTTEDASLKGFQKSISNYGYHMQSAWYLDGVSHAFNEPMTDFVHLVVEKSPPYGVALYTLDDGSLQKAREDISKILVQFAECNSKNEWPSYGSDIQNVSIPAWMF